MQTEVINIFLFSRLFLAVLLHFVWQATLIFILVAIVREMIGPRYVQARYLISVIGLFAVLSAPLATVSYYFSSPEALATLNPQVVENGNQFVPVESNNLLGQLEARFQKLFRWFDGYRNFWLGCWTAGFVVLLGRLCLALGFCLRLRRSQQRLPPHLEQLAASVKHRLKIARNVVVASSNEITQAVATGVIRPMVLVPAAWVSQLPVSAIEAVLAHELAHIRRWDLWVNLLQRFIETVFFFHPLVWWLSRMISNEREICCDRLAIMATGNPMHYVETLARVAGATTIDDFEFQFGNAFTGDKKMNLLRRAKLILEPGSITSQSPFRTLTLIACVGLLACYGSYAYCTMPNPVIARLQDRETGRDHKENIDVVVVKDQDAQDENENEVLHRHLIELLHGSESGQVDRQKLAQHLRQLADQIEARHNQSLGHDEQEHLTIRSPNAKALDVRVIGPDDNGNYRRLQVEPVPGGSRIVRRTADDNGHMIIELAPEETGEIYEFTPTNAEGDKARNGGKQRAIIRAKKMDPNQKVIVGEIHGVLGSQANAHGTGKVRLHELEIRKIEAGESKAHAEHGNHLPALEVRGLDASDPRVRTGMVSDEELGQVIRDLKTEVQKLRQELDELRSNR